MAPVHLPIPLSPILLLIMVFVFVSVFVFVVLEGTSTSSQSPLCLASEIEQMETRKSLKCWKELGGRKASTSSTSCLLEHLRSQLVAQLVVQEILESNSCHCKELSSNRL